MSFLDMIDNGTIHNDAEALERRAASRRMMLAASRYGGAHSLSVSDYDPFRVSHARDIDNTSRQDDRDSASYEDHSTLRERELDFGSNFRRRSPVRDGRTTSHYDSRFDSDSPDSDDSYASESSDAPAFPYQRKRHRVQIPRPSVAAFPRRAVRARIEEPRPVQPVPQSSIDDLRAACESAAGSDALVLAYERSLLPPVSVDPDHPADAAPAQAQNVAQPNEDAQPNVDQPMPQAPERPVARAPPARVAEVDRFTADGMFAQMCPAFNRYGGFDPPEDEEPAHSETEPSRRTGVNEDGDHCFLCWAHQSEISLSEYAFYMTQQRIIHSHIISKPPHVFCRAVRLHYEQEILPILQVQHRKKWKERVIWEHFMRHTREAIFIHYRTFLVYNAAHERLTDYALFREHPMTKEQGVELNVMREFTKIETAMNNCMNAIRRCHPMGALALSTLAPGEGCANTRGGDGPVGRGSKSRVF
jgi:hypothetical protein